MENRLISVIVPVYKVEKYLPKCIESIMNQTHKNIEIILVDDGSPDNCGVICDEYAQKDSRIKVIHKENGGLSSARNAGMDIAKGEYITFVDSDDYISQDLCRDLLESLLRNEADIAICNVQRFTEQNPPIEEENQHKENIYSKEEAIYNLIYHGDFYDLAYGKLYTKKALKNIRFPLNRIYEDSATIFKIYYNIDKIVVLDKKYYFYLVQREGSIINSTFTMKKLNDNYLLIKERFDFLTERMPQMKDTIMAGCIRNSLTLFERVYLSGDEELINSDIVKDVEARMRELLEKVDKNVLCTILNSYRLACLFLLMQNKDLYAKNLKQLFESK